MHLLNRMFVHNKDGHTTKKFILYLIQAVTKYELQI